MTIKYNKPNGTKSSIDTGNNGQGQLVPYKYKRAALIEVMDEIHFGLLADTESMPKNSGKEIKQNLYVPLLDDRNINTEGINAAGVAIDNTKVTVVIPKGRYNLGAAAASTIALINGGSNPAAAAAVAGQPNQFDVLVGAIDNITTANAPTILTAVNTTAVPGAGFLNGGAYTKAQSGYLYGSDRDFGSLSDRFPVIGEEGGTANQVGFTRLELKGSLQKYGFYHKFTQESLDFDSDAELQMHLSREMLRGANKINEDLLQRDLINAAGTIRLSGAATTIKAMTNSSSVSFGDLVRLGIALDKKHTPKKTEVIAGSTLQDTRTIPASRIMFVGSELLPTLMSMTNFQSQPAWIPVEQYTAAAGYILPDEAGSIAGFRVVVVNDMLKMSGGGAAIGGNTTHYTTGGTFDVFPMLVVGSNSFTTIGFQSGSSQDTKFTVLVKKPGYDMVSEADPFGERGLSSIKWYYGFMALRPERIAVQWTTAVM